MDYADHSGRRIVEAIGPDRKQAEAVLKLRMADVVNGRHYIPTEKNLTFAQYAQEWLRLHAPDLKPKTRENYGMALRVHLIPAFGPMRLGAITERHVAEYRARRVEEARQIEEQRRATEAADVETRKRVKLPRPLSPASINYHLEVLNIALNDAARKGYILRNPAHGVPKVPLGRNREDEMHFLTPDQIRAMLGAAPQDLYPLLLMAVMTGLRRGELLALTWDDVDVTAGKITVRASLGRVKTDDGYRLDTSQPKSKKSRRVDLPPEVADAIKELPSRFARGLVFCQDNGRPLDPDNLVKRDFARVLRRAKVPRVRFHDLRHTYASLLIAQKAHPKYIQAQLGHASITTTLNTYGHLMPEMHEEEAKRLGLLVFGAADGEDTLQIRNKGQDIGGQIAASP